ncbi:carboxymuconolactone decarboxylase family protein [Streptomyces sp. NPDC051776]|uniref:carboxymuconolactone decarboxylase family protein n=1 Tax=Streptomyces sp. NPDC051776 TaxID=3155414 RepID=UPI0034301986
MARISLDQPRTLFVRLTDWYSRRTYGTALDPARTTAHQPRVLMSQARFERSLAKWNKLAPELKALAVMASAASIRCSWCIDFGYWDSRRHGMDHRKLHDVPAWRGSDVYTPLERAVMAYAEAVTATPPAVDDAMVERLREHLDEAQLVELTAMIAVENLRSRVNAALGLTSQGFKDRCDVPQPLG